MSSLNRWEQYVFKTHHKGKGRHEYEHYSCLFDSYEDAFKWYLDERRGVFLRNLFKRELFLFKGKEKLNIEFQ